MDNESSLSSKNSFFKNTLSITSKEIWSLFTSPIAVLFVGCFLLTSLFSFFWIEKFFASNISSMRGFFKWMPALLIPLSSAITMKMWSEEKQSGNLEFLLTLPTSEWSLVLGKFIACLNLAKIALVLTLPLAFSVCLFTEIELLPLIIAYAACGLLAATYIAIGLYVSSKTENQIVSFLLSSILCSILYFIGTQNFTSLFDYLGVEILEKISTSSRFESITRGVLDFSDIYYYLSLTFAFLILNVFSLKKLRWANSKETSSSHNKSLIFFILILTNVVIANFWINQIKIPRADLTKDKLYSLSNATSSTLDLLSEPLNIYGYFSAKTHPLLAPLVPRLRDLIEEYEEISGGKISVQILDPRQDQEEEEFANKRFGVKPIPFQLTDKYQASLINSYFNIVVSYGDQYEVLGAQDLIDIIPGNNGGVEVELKNPEYDITSAIKKAIFSFKNIDNLFANLKKPINVTGYISDDNKLPQQLLDFKTNLVDVISEFKNSAKDKINFKIIDPIDVKSSVGKKIFKEYGFRPMTTSLFDDEQFYFYILLEDESKRVQLPLPQELTKESLIKAFGQGFKRFSTSFTKSIGIWSPLNKQSIGRPGVSYQVARELLGESHNLVNLDLKSGVIGSEIDMAIILEPTNLGVKEVFAIDQFLMKGATVVIATSPYTVEKSQTSMSIEKLDSGLSDWLANYGVDIEDKLVLDTENTPFPVPTIKDLGNFKVQQIELIPYPFFATSKRNQGKTLPAVWGGLSELNMAWSSPINFENKNNSLSFKPIVSSSVNSWLTSNIDIQPDFKLFPELGFKVESEQLSYVLASSIKGSFTSFFENKNSPLIEEEESVVDTNTQVPSNKEIFASVINKSPKSSKLFVIASNEFLSDDTLQIMASVGSNSYKNSLTFIQNLVDYALDDPTLAQIRGRSLTQKTLPTISRAKQKSFEYLNYLYAIIGLILLVVFFKILWKMKEARYKALLS